MDIEKLTRFEPDKIPRLLAMHPQWICWKSKPKDNGKVDKIPINPVSLRPAKTNDRATWTTFKTAVTSARKNGLGLGFVFSETDDLIGVDLDDCFEGGKPKPWAIDIVDGLESYSEITPSGAGLHVIVKGKLTGKRRRKGQVEVYSTGRFFTVTGERLGDVNYILNHQSGVDAFYLKHFGEEPQPKPEPVPERTPLPTQNYDAILDGLKIIPLFQRLFAGDIGSYESQSEADLALCSICAKRTHDPQLIDSIFRQSGLYRDKWDEQRGAQTYGEITIEKALAGAPTLPVSNASKETSETITIKTIGELMTTEFPQVVDIISGGILPEGGGLILAGESEAGKSMLSMEISLHLAMARQLFDGRLLVPKKRRILVLQVENPEPQIKQRLKRMLNGLNISVEALSDRIFFADPQTIYDLMQPKCVASIAEIVRQCSADVLVADPLSSFHYLEENDNSRMRTALDNITHISRETGCAAIVIHHYGKPQQGRDDAYRLRGASSIKDWADSVISVTQKKHEDKQLVELRFDKVRHGPKPKPILLERNENFISMVTEEEMMISAKEVRDILIHELGGEAETKFQLIKALRDGYDCCENTAKKAIHRAEDLEYIAIRKGKGRSKKVVPFRA
ncbi:MAG: AAA family ATPase [Nitrospina sp.]|jgi:putative DNA primase/helicase|nr:AAA family ATPase [Nitrospina sp.]